MSISGLIVTYVVLWWLIFFTTLPFGVEAQRDPVPGSEPGAPERPRLWLKALVTTVLAALATWGVEWFIAQGFIAIRPATPP